VTERLDTDKDQAFVPTILVLSTNNISDPGIDLAGSSHMHYSPKVMVISLPCTSGIKPGWVLYAMQQGFDGVFVAADGDECAYLSDCSERTSQIMADAQTLLQEDGFEPQRLRMAAICSVCAEPFTNYMHEFSKSLTELGPSRKASAA
jgi:F420-non-reducing hydrogenase iron-sulfur subunit